MRKSAADSLGEIKSEQAIPQLIKLLEHQDYDVRSCAADALEKIKSEQAIPQLIELLEHQDYNVRINAIAALVKIKSDQAIHPLIKLLEDQNSDVRINAMAALCDIKPESAIPQLIKLFEHQDSNVHYIAAEALVKIKSEQAIPQLIKLLEHQDSNVRSRAAKALGEIKSEQAVPQLIKLFEHQDFHVRSRAADALGKIKSEQAVPRLIKLLEDQNSDVRSRAADALGEIKSEKVISNLIEALNNQSFLQANNGQSSLKALEALAENQEYFKYYRVRESCQNREVRIMTKVDNQIRILHLSDIHLETGAQAQRYFTQLASDLTQNLNVKQLNYLVISGDIANRSTQEEYEAAFELVDKLVQRYELDPSRIVIVPGNHDLNWELSENAFTFVPTRKLPKPLPEGRYIKAGSAGALIRNETEYKKRFDYFNNYFYQKIYNKPYPQEYNQQAIIYPYPENNILFLGLNSCWEIDHEYKNRAGIHPNAVANALGQILSDNYEDWLKIAVWHHPVNGSESIKNIAFLEQLAVNGFQLGIHGHIHEAKDENFYYDIRRRLRIIAAGTFLAPTSEQVTGIPLQYNLLTLDRESGILTVETRKKEKTDGAWSADARWGDKNNPVPRYTIELQYGNRSKNRNFSDPPAKPPLQNERKLKSQNLKLDANTINELIEILNTFMEDEKSRRPFLTTALGNDAQILQRISWSGTVADFIPDMVRKLASYGRMPSGKQALWVLLEYARSQVGIDVQQRIDELSSFINL